MSARDEIVGLIAGSNECIRPLAERVADGILAKHARELAAKVRSDVESDEAYRPKWRQGMLDAADKIEPKG